MLYLCIAYLRYCLTINVIYGIYSDNTTIDMNDLNNKDYNIYVTKICPKCIQVSLV